MDKYRLNKIRSKLLRIEISDKIKKFIESFDFKNLKETQVGDYVYRANGFIRIHGKIEPITVSLKMVDGDLKATLFLSRIKHKVVGPLDQTKLKERLMKSLEKHSN
jgi:hypothetical protein